MKARQVVRRDKMLLNETTRNCANPRMNNPFCSNENGKGNQESDMHFDIVKERNSI